MKVGDLVRDFPDEMERFSSRYGIVVKVTDCKPWSDDIEVWFGDEIEEWEEDEIEVISESR